MKPTRQAQPYRGGLAPGRVADAMKRGRTANGMNPMDVRRAAQRMLAASKARQGRKPRPARPSR